MAFVRRIPTDLSTTRWLYYEEAETKLLLDEKRADYPPHHLLAGIHVASCCRTRHAAGLVAWSLVISEIAATSIKLLDSGVPRAVSPLWIRDDGLSIWHGWSSTSWQPVGSRAPLPGPPGPGRRGPVSPCPSPCCTTPPTGRPTLTHSGLEWTPHPAAGLAGRRHARSGGRAG